MGPIGLPEMIIILLIIVLLFGATRIPQLARSLGKSVSEFKKGVREGEQEEPAKKSDEKEKAEKT